ncbi:MAG: type II toxin-antitoxin system PemK/MazF family toxin [Microthrixaceae bacterium]
MLTVVPITSNVSHVYQFQVLLPAGITGLRKDSKAQAEQVRSVSIDRLGPRVGELDAGLLGDLDEVLRLHLGL